MSIDKGNLLFFAVIMCVLISTGSCLKCYNCVGKSPTDPCMDPKGHNLVPQECGAEKINNLANQVSQYAQNFGAAIGVDIDKETKHVTNVFVCMKAETQVTNKDTVLVRACGVKEPDVCEVLKQQKSKNDMVIHCSVCEEDGCNAGHWLAPLTSLALLLPALAAMFL